MTRKKTKQTKLWKKSEFYFILFLLILVGGFLIQLVLVNILPFKVLLPVIVVVLLLTIGMCLLQIGKRVNKVNKLLGKILIVAMSIVLGFGNWYLYATQTAFSEITKENSQLDVISIVVLKESKYNKLKDINNGEIEYSKSSNVDNINKVLKDLKKDLNEKVNIKSSDSYVTMTKSLFDGEVNAIILDESTRGMIDDDNPDFSAKTKVIKEYKYKTITKTISKNVDVTSKPFNVYISGIDTYGSISTVSRSDVNMIASINPKTHQILLISVPRDYYIKQTCQGNQKDKLTHTGIYGVNCTIDSMNNFFGIDMNYYVRVNFSSVVDIVNALDGIVVENPTAFRASNNTYWYDAGNVEMDGEKALYFARERYIFSGGDRDRGKNQMRVITGIINKALSPKIITNYTEILNAVSGSFQTNMSSKEITSFIKMQLNDMSGWKITQYAVDGVGETNWSPANGFNSYVMEPDMTTVNKAIELIKKLQNGEILEL